MEYIKRDLLFQLILNGTLTPIDNIPDSILLQWYINEKSFNIIKDIIKFAPSILGSGNQFIDVLKGVAALVKGIKEQCKKFKKFKTEITEGDFEKAVNIIDNLSEGAGNIYELDPISWLIAQSIAKQDKKSVLIIEDLDRIDPAHLFRILNIFSAHIDRHYLCSDKTIFQDDEEKPFDELPNKFGFDKIIFVMDADSANAAFKNFYGDSNYEGYISKFISKRIFHYSITEYAQGLLYTHIEEKCGINQSIFYWALNSVDVKIEQKSVRDIAKVLDNFEDAYRKEKVSVTDDFCFLSDTPFVKLLATLGRLGVKKTQVSTFLEEIEPKDKLIELLGCFTMEDESMRKNNLICYKKEVFEIDFKLNQGLYSSVIRVNNYTKIATIEGFRFPEINVNEILERALKYVN